MKFNKKKRCKTFGGWNSQIPSIFANINFRSFKLFFFSHYSASSRFTKYQRTRILSLLWIFTAFARTLHAPWDSWHLLVHIYTFNICYFIIYVTIISNQTLYKSRPWYHRLYIFCSAIKRILNMKKALTVLQRKY